MEKKSENDKIYSRPRFCIKTISFRKLPKEKRKKYNIVVKLCIIFLIALITSYSIMKSINPIINQLCIDEAKNIATRVSNEQATKVMSNYSYDDLISITRDNNNKISLIQANAKTINDIVSEIPIKIIDEMENNTNSDIHIYLGSILGFKIFSGSGPRINAKVANIGNVDTTLKSDFISQGINQTLHRIYLEIKLNVSILTPYDIINTSIVNQVLIAESIIIGEIPNYFYTK